VDDAVRGDVRFNTSAVGDFVVMRSNGLPVYNFCVAVDDALMHISHVIRAEEHLPNTLRQVAPARLLRPALLARAQARADPARGGRRRAGAHLQRVRLGDADVRACVPHPRAGQKQAVQAARRDVGGRVPAAGLPAGRHGQLPVAAGLERRHRAGAPWVSYAPRYFLQVFWRAGELALSADAQARAARLKSSSGCCAGDLHGRGPAGQVLAGQDNQEPRRVRQDQAGVDERAAPARAGHRGGASARLPPPAGVRPPHRVSTARCKQRSLAHQARSLSLTHEHARGAACFAAADARGGAAQLLPKLASGWTQSGLLAREDGAFVAAAVQLVKNSLELVVDAEPELRRLLAYPLADTLASAAAAPVLEDNFLEARARPSLTSAGLGLGRRCSLASRHGASPAAGGCGHGGGRVARRAP